jgi:hypothetical protein
LIGVVLETGDWFVCKVVFSDGENDSMLLWFFSIEGAEDALLLLLGPPEKEKSLFSFNLLEIFAGLAILVVDHPTRLLPTTLFLSNLNTSFSGAKPIVDGAIWTFF